MQSSTRTMPAKNFDNINLAGDTGFDSSKSIVPERYSSANVRMVSAGTKKRYSHGANTNKPSILA